MPRVAKRGSMPTDVIMPQMGESIFEGTITKWLKKAGDAVEKDEPLFEISTDKVDAEIPSPVAGVLSEIKVPEGATVEINTVVAVVTEKQGSGIRDQGSENRDQGSENREQGTGIRDQGTVGGPVIGGTDVVMPQMGESIFEGTITKWLKKAGDTVEKDEPLFEISTDKVDAEIPAPVAGVLTEIKVQEGATVEINTVVAVIGGTGGSGGSRRFHRSRAEGAVGFTAGGLPLFCRTEASAFAPRRWCGGLPKTTTSTWRRSRAQARAGASPKKMSCAT
jgi:pyruvate dehydrogenase E2 component (dihydrolipoamide acetyltransferase)